MSTLRRRVARKDHDCGHGLADNNCRSIRPGDVYGDATLFPGDDAGGGLNHPIRMAVCAPCVLDRNSVHAYSSVLDPIPYEQLCRQALL
jgi:hypothetical protein